MHQYSGCTAISCLIDEHMKLYTANTGDSRAIISVGGVARSLSYDHKPNRLDERNRIQQTGLTIHRGRVEGQLAMSRAFGDPQFKRVEGLARTKQAVVATPTLIEYQLTRDCELLILASDGKKF